jgi:hypothetical protein
MKPEDFDRAAVSLVADIYGQPFDQENDPQVFLVTRWHLEKWRQAVIADALYELERLQEEHTSVDGALQALDEYGARVERGEA